jgi:hypothetical protein
MPPRSPLLHAAALASALTVVASMPVAAQTLPGLTFSVASDPNNFGVGSFFRSNGTGIAEVGSFNGGIVRALSEFNVTGQGTTSQATLSFRVNSVGGLSGQPATQFNYNLGAYQGNNFANISDFSISEFQPIGSFRPDVLSVGQTLSFNVTNIFNNFVSIGNLNSLGFRLAPVSDPAGGAYTFNNFQLTLGSAATTVPEPATVARVGSGLLVVGGLAGRRRARKTG